MSKDVLFEGKSLQTQWKRLVDVDLVPGGG